MKDITESLLKIVKETNIYKKEPMSKHTSFKIGGMADYFVKIESEEELKNVLNLAKNENVPYCIVGNGTNLLVREGGIRGIVLKIEQDNYTIKQHKNFAEVKAQSGISLAKLAFVAMENGLTGLENVSGIPGTLGGAIKMNAGAYGTEMKDVMVCSKCMDENGQIRNLQLEEHQFEYRKSIFAKNELILLETTIRLKYGEKAQIKEKMEECRKKRMQHQPLEFPNAGSTFKRNPNVPTAKLIEEAGLKGYRIGDAEVSTKHAGFVVNRGKATAKDVLALVEQIQKVVKEKFEQEIELEIIVIGEE